MSRRTMQSALRSVGRIAALSVLTLAACEHPTEVIPGTRAVPPDIARTLTGAVGTPIFPTAPPGERQTIGDARGLNSAGQVTGAERGLTAADEFRAYRFTPGGGIVMIVGPFVAAHFGSDINDAGLIAGTTQSGVFQGNRGFVAAGTSMTVLDILPGVSPEADGQAVAVNNAGTVAGWSHALDATRHAVLWSSSAVIQDLGTPSSEAIDINAAGQVIGSGPLGTAPFYLWAPGSGVRNLNTELGALTSVVAINDAGQIIGTYTASGGDSHAFLYTPGPGLLDLGTLGGATSAPTGLNNNGQVVGTSLTSGGVAHAFLWTPTDGMEDVTATTGVNDIRRLNDNLQTLTGAVPPTVTAHAPDLAPRLVQLSVTQSNSPPLAIFTVSCNGLTCALDASGSLDDRPGLTYSWNLDKIPDGSATGQKVTVTYAHESQRTVTLTVTDAQGLTSSSSQTFSVSDYPIAAFTYACTGLTCSFDASGSTNGSGAPVDHFRWTFGDGAGGLLAPTLSHTFAQPGTYDVKLEVWAGTSQQRAILIQQVTVTSPAQNQPPVANFTSSCSGTICTLDASTSTDDVGIVSYDWTLDKAPGGTASGVIVTTEILAPQHANVTLTVTDAAGLSNSITKAVVVGAPPEDASPVARFTSSCNGTVCTLDASTSTDDIGIVSYDWTLDKAPGGTASGVSVTTDYWHTSTRTVTLTVTDTKGQQNSVTQTVNVP